MTTANTTPDKVFSVFRGLAPEEEERLLRMGERVTYGAEQEIIIEGQAKKRLRVVMQGKLKVVKKVKDDRSKTVAVVKEGETCGFISLFTDQPSSATLVSTEVTEMWEIDRDVLRRLFDEEPRLATKLLTNLLNIGADRIRVLNDQVALLGSLFLEGKRYDVRDLECPVFGACLLSGEPRPPEKRTGSGTTSRENEPIRG